MAQYFENRGTLRELSQFNVPSTSVNLTTTHNDARNKDINWLQPNYFMTEPFLRVIQKDFAELC